ncbi:MAG: hypothetical protein VX589_10430 [Myxococcota bacterium]|nr:hypothetical protein [Myxococcota bacterium]
MSTHTDGEGSCDGPPADWVNSAQDKSAGEAQLDGPDLCSIDNSSEYISGEDEDVNSEPAQYDSDGGY